MSRTDKDLPYWFGYKYVARHNCMRYHRECNLIEDPTKQRRYASLSYLCYWEPIHENGRTWWQWAPRKWFIDHVWNAPQRVTERDKARKMIAEYRANREVDTEIPSIQHRHMGQWLWW